MKYGEYVLVGANRRTGGGARVGVVVWAIWKVLKMDGGGFVVGWEVFMAGGGVDGGWGS